MPLSLSLTLTLSTKNRKLYSGSEIWCRGHPSSVAAAGQRLSLNVPTPENGKHPYRRKGLQRTSSWGLLAASLPSPWAPEALAPGTAPWPWSSCPLLWGSEAAASTPTAPTITTQGSRPVALNFGCPGRRLGSFQHD